MDAPDPLSDREQYFLSDKGSFCFYEKFIIIQNNLCYNKQTEILSFYRGSSGIFPLFYFESYSCPAH